jgi:hypothetical protein
VTQSQTTAQAAVTITKAMTGIRIKAIQRSPAESGSPGGGLRFISSRFLNARQGVRNFRRSSHHHEQGAEADCRYERGSRGIKLSIVASEICKLTPLLAAPAIIRKANYLAVAHDAS